MAKHIKEIAHAALRTITATPQPLTNTKLVDDFDWQFEIIGSADEKKQLQAMLDASKAFLSEVHAGQEPRWLTLCGKSGVGKTHLARRIWEFMRQHAEGIYNRTERNANDPGWRNYLSCYAYAQEKGIFVRWADLVRTSREGDYYPIDRARLDWIKIIDDIGAAGHSSERTTDGQVKLTPFVLEKLGDVCDGRIRKWTVLTSNFNRKQIAEHFDVRIASRLGRDRNVIVECNVKDYSLRS